MPTLFFGLGLADLMLTAAAFGAALACIWLALGIARSERAGLARAAATRRTLDQAESDLAGMAQRIDALAERHNETVERLEAEITAATGSGLDRRLQRAVDEQASLLRAEIAAAGDTLAETLAETLRTDMEERIGAVRDAQNAQTDQQAEAIAAATAAARDSMSETLAEEAAAVLSAARDGATAAAEAACETALAKAVSEAERVAESAIGQGVAQASAHAAEAARAEARTTLDAILPGTLDAVLPDALDALLTPKYMAALIAAPLAEALAAALVDTGAEGRRAAPATAVSAETGPAAPSPVDTKRIATKQADAASALSGATRQIGAGGRAGPSVVGVFPGRPRQG